ncbi:MAG TPA: SURF1 family protein [Nocardioidaceae bacterium]|nr:SURF1 family protein [Nocardioidaceae bacterium]
MRFLFSRRWILFAIAVALMAYGAVKLGEWQFHRLDERETRNAIVTKNLDEKPVPVASVMAPGRPLSEADQWEHVTASGRYVDDETIVVRYQTRDGASGVDVVTPLLTDSGTAVLVNRGWEETGNTGTTRPDVPPAPDGEVTVVGWARADAEGDATAVADRSTRAISSEAIGPTLPFPVYGGFVEVESQTPPPAHPLVPTERPDLSNGPHFFYGLQWWFFGALAIFGFFYLAWDERRKARRAGEPSTAEKPAPVKS